MSNYDNTNRGAAWKNDKRENNKHPAYKGSLNADGKEYWISFWGKNPNGNPKAPDITYSLQPKEEQPQQQAAASPSSFDEDLPF